MIATMAKAYRAYRKQDPHSYAIGVFTVLEMLATTVAVEALIVPEHDQANDGLCRILEIAAERRIRLVRGDRLLERIAGKGNCQAVGVFVKRENDLDPAADHLVVVEPADQGNLGTILRTMRGYGVRDLALIGQAVDHFNPRVIRASMGACFSARIRRFATHSDYLTAYQRSCYPFLLDGASDLQAVRFAHPCSLVFGNEAAGLPAAWHDVGTPVRIRHSSAIDSLNLAVAVGTALYEMRRGTRGPGC